METASRKYEIKDEPFSLEKVSHLLKNHWLESAKNKDLMVLSPDGAKFKMLELQGSLFCLYAYCDDKVIGYSANIVNTHLHYSDLMVCYNDVLFIDQDHRGSSIGLKLIKETEKVAVERGAEVMLWHAKEDTALAGILPRLGCNVHEKIFSKQLC